MRVNNHNLLVLLSCQLNRINLLLMRLRKITLLLALLNQLKIMIQTKTMKKKKFNLKKNQLKKKKSINLQHFHSCQDQVWYHKQKMRVLTQKNKHLQHLASFNNQHLKLQKNKKKNKNQVLLDLYSNLQQKLRKTNQLQFRVSIF